MKFVLSLFILQLSTRVARCMNFLCDEYWQKVLIVGDPGVGKTSLLKQYVENEFSYIYKATSSAYSLTKKDVIVGWLSTTQEIWDISGRNKAHLSRFRTICAKDEHFYTSPPDTIWDLPASRARDELLDEYRTVYVSACILVYDITNPQSFDNLERWKREFVTAAKPTKVNFPFIVIGNKVDLATKQQISESRARVKQWCEVTFSDPECYFECSAKNPERTLAEAFKKAVELRSGELPPPWYKDEQCLVPLVLYAMMICCCIYCCKCCCSKSSEEDAQPGQPVPTVDTPKSDDIEQDACPVTPVDEL